MREEMIKMTVEELQVRHMINEVEELIHWCEVLGYDKCGEELKKIGMELYQKLDVNAEEDS